MTTINTIDDLLRIVRENEEYRVALRRELLTDDLLALPGQIAEILKTQNELRETQNRILVEQEESRKVQNELRETQNRILVEQEESRKVQNELRETQNEILAEQEQSRQTQNRILAEQEESRRTQNEILAEQERFRRTQNEMLDTQSEILKTLSEIIKTQGEILRRLGNVEAHNRRLSDDFGAFRGNYAESAARKNAAAIMFSLDEVKSLGIDELTMRVLSPDMIRALAGEYGSERLASIPRSERLSFYLSDLIIEVAKTDGTTFYIAVEASYTCNGRDTARALSHADLITRFTGKEAWPVIAGVRMDKQIQPLVDNGRVFWYQLEDVEMEPDEPLQTETGM